MAGALNGKVAIVTGGNSGIGEATVQRLAREGAKVAILARREAEGVAAQQAVRDAGGDATFIRCDVMERTEIEAAVARTIELYGGLHIIFNNAGGAFPHSLSEAGDEAWEKTLRLNLTSIYIMTQIAWPHLVAAGSASVVNTSSMAAVAAASAAQQALVPGLPSPAYWAAKGGVEAFTRYTATAGAAHGIRANVVRPGAILTPMATRLTPGHHIFEPIYEQIQLTEGPGYPEDVANAVFFLASDESRFINGQVLNIDGGAVGKV
jgi:NAD(P)-dependent dehydrogenase (short-subunit alcohol dehydrogenase family)